MENTLIINDIESVIQNGIDEVNKRILEGIVKNLEQEIRESNQTGNRKKAISFMKTVSKQLEKGARPTLSGIVKQHISFNKSDMWCWCDCYCMAFTNDQLIQESPDISGYPTMDNLVRGFECDVDFDLKQLDYPSICLEYKKNKKESALDMVSNGKTRRYAAKYLKFALDLLGQDNLKVYFTNKDYSIMLIQNSITGEFVGISPMRTFK